MLRDAEIEIYGELLVDEDCCSIDGIAIGVTEENWYSFKPTRMQGFSSERGSIWLERLTFPLVTLSGDERRPATIQVRAYSMYWGDFDPTRVLVDRATMKLGELPRLLVRDPMSGNSLQDPRPSYPEVRELHKTDEYTLSLEVGSDAFGNQRYQHLNVNFTRPSHSSKADKIFDLATTLIAIVTNSPFSTCETQYLAKQEAARRWKIGGARERDHSIVEWLRPCNKIVDLIQAMLPAWTAFDGAFHQGQVFLGAGDPAVTMESEFLTYCHCFEDLNRRRRQGSLMDEDDFSKYVVGELEPRIMALANVNSRTRRKVLKAVKDANSPNLSSRLRHAFAEIPNWIETISQQLPVSRELKQGFDIFDRIEARRNQISHGNPGGSVRSAEEAHRLNLDGAVMFLYCLGELLFVGGLQDEEVSNLVRYSSEMSQVLWLATQEPPTAW